MRQTAYPDLTEQYEMPGHACDIRVGDVFIAQGHHCPDGFCQSAWMSLYPFVIALSSGGGDFYDGWMKNKTSAMISCNDGFRPMSYLLETLEEEDV